MNKKRIPAGRTRLVTVIKNAGAVVSIDDAVKALRVSRKEAAKLLSRWAEQGWLRRVGPGLYLPVELELLDSVRVIQDEWILIPALFAPAYIGGRTAAEHWDLTEQIFRDIVVFTARRVAAPVVERQKTVFILKHTTPDRMFGTHTIWRGQTKVAVSDLHRTIVDMLDDPAIGGGIRHVADCLEQYLGRPDRDFSKLVSYADRLGNGAIFKRLGFLAEQLPAGSQLVEASLSRLTKGFSQLDPALDCTQHVTRWRLRVPPTWLEHIKR